MQSTAPGNTPPDYLFSKLFDRYVRRVADQCDLPELTSQLELVNKVDVSPLTGHDQQGFDDWLSKRFYLRIGIENALRRGLLVTVNRAGNVEGSRADYAVRIEGQ